jgi:uncharacterized protein (DUF488 family)
LTAKGASGRFIVSPSPGALTILTIGHSTRPFEELLDLLRAHAVTLLFDVRTVPASRRNPQYHREALALALEQAGIRYLHMPGLGGLRRASADSPNLGWRNTAFRGFADYMQTPAFTDAIDSLVEMAKEERVAIMCAEALPWRCHRSLISDALTVRGVRVEHILGREKTRPHRLTPWARVEGERITYPPPLEVE